VTETGASAADCFHSMPETDYYTAVLAAALWEAQRLPIGEGQFVRSPELQWSAVRSAAELRTLSERCYSRLLKRQRPDGTFAYTEGDYGFLRDGRSYPRPQVMTLFHLLYPAGGNGFEWTA
jgi:hypothetical protein